eukprot:TRINITY_DN7020_c2_g1_i2.p2 TRINITY_DN7020_c2_g1~~TRINITY_DN7020_c2_g1_i2.p2  ORF type:complete len:215 (-),score=33.03 TRINITY_DN7020_c2_g1_i2:302-946(-)
MWRWQTRWLPLLCLCLSCLEMVWTAAQIEMPEEVSVASVRRLPALDVQLLSSLTVLLSSGASAPIAWHFVKTQYSLSVPAEAIAAAIVCVLNPAIQKAEVVEMTLFRPEDNRQEVLTSGVSSGWADVPTEEAASFILQLRLPVQAKATNYTILIIRSTITSNFQFVYPDPASLVPAAATLTSLIAVNAFGTPLRTDPEFFQPRRRAPKHLLVLL